MRTYLNRASSRRLARGRQVNIRMFHLTPYTHISLPTPRTGIGPTAAPLDPHPHHVPHLFFSIFGDIPDVRVRPAGYQAYLPPGRLSTGMSRTQQYERRAPGLHGIRGDHDRCVSDWYPRTVRTFVVVGVATNAPSTAAPALRFDVGFRGIY